MAPWQTLFVMAGAAGALAGAIGAYMHRNVREDALAAMRERAAHEAATFGAVTYETRRELKRAFRRVESPTEEGEDGVGVMVTVGALVGVLLASGLTVAFWFGERWDGSYWPVLEQRTPSLTSVERLASEALESDVTCVEGDAERRYVCGRGRRGAFVVRVSAGGDRVVIER